MTKKEDFIRRGHALAQEMRACPTPSALAALESKLKEYSDQLDEEFGVIGDPSWPEKSTSLTMSLWVAFNWWRDHLAQPDNADTARLADQYLEQFIEALDSGDWN